MWADKTHKKNQVCFIRNCKTIQIKLNRVILHNMHMSNDYYTILIGYTYSGYFIIGY